MKSPEKLQKRISSLVIFLFDMTKGERLKNMTAEERIRTFLPLLIAKTITQESYDKLLNYECSVSNIHEEAGPLSENSEGLAEPLEDVQDTELVQPQDTYPLPAEPIGEITLPGLATDATHPNLAKGNSQKAKIFQVLQDGQWHNANDISYQVYGGHGGIRANWTARMTNLRKDLEDNGYQLLSRKLTKTLWEYRIAR